MEEGKEVEENTDKREKEEKEEMKEDRKRHKKPPHRPGYLLLCNPCRDYVNTIMNYF